MVLGIALHRGGCAHDRDGRRRALSATARSHHDQTAKAAPQAARRAGWLASATTPTSGGEDTEPDPHQPRHHRQPWCRGACPATGRRRAWPRVSDVATPKPAAREPRDRAGHAGKSQRCGHPRGGDEPACAGDHDALAEPIHQPIADQPPEEHEPDKRDVAGTPRSRPARRGHRANTVWPRNFRHLQPIAPAIAMNTKRDQCRCRSRLPAACPPVGPR